MARPRFSIVIPAYNEATLLPLCLESIENQDYQGSYEVIVADNGSTDRTARIAQAYDAKVVSVTNGQGPVFARIGGIKKAQGDIIVSTDADTVVPPNWLSEYDQAFRDKRVMAVSGGIEFNNADTLAKKIVQTLTPFMLLFYRGFLGANFAVRRTAYDDIGGFDQTFGTYEDYKMYRDLRKAGHKVAYLRGVKVRTSARRFAGNLFSTIGSYWIANFASIWSGKGPYLKTLEAIREKPFDINQRIIKHPMLTAIVIAALGLAIYAGFDPRLNIYSKPRVATDQKLIALTFDDGPTEPATPQILDTLKHYDVKATFFEVGVNVRRHPDIARRVVDEGHVIANHSDNHSLYFMTHTPTSILGNVNNAEDSIYKATGVKPHFYRPPYGFRTVWGARSISKNGYFIVTWDDMTYDYWGLSADKIKANIVKKAKPGGIIVLHDGHEANEEAKRDNVVTALPAIIESLKAQGYTFVTLDQLFDTPAYR